MISFFATNLEDGKVYRISSGGAVVEMFDPFLADNGINGIAPQDEQLWAIQVESSLGISKVYFARYRNTITNKKEIWSVELLPGGGFFKHTET